MIPCGSLSLLDQQNPELLEKETKISLVNSWEATEELLLPPCLHSRICKSLLWENGTMYLLVIQTGIHYLSLERQCYWAVGLSNTERPLHHSISYRGRGKSSNSHKHESSPVLPLPSFLVRIRVMFYTMVLQKAFFKFMEYGINRKVTETKAKTTFLVCIQVRTKCCLSHDGSGPVKSAWHPWLDGSLLAAREWCLTEV